MPDMRGRAPASAKQKAIARQTIAKTKPWEKSTGPKTAEGKARCANKHHRWGWHIETDCDGCATIINALPKRLRFFKQHLEALGLPPYLNTRIKYKYEHQVWTIAITMRCPEIVAAILEMDCPGWLTPQLPTESLWRQQQQNQTTNHERMPSNSRLRASSRG
jgi:hypothetical protein